MKETFLWLAFLATLVIFDAAFAAPAKKAPARAPAIVETEAASNEGDELLGARLIADPNLAAKAEMANDQPLEAANALQPLPEKDAKIEIPKKDLAKLPENQIPVLTENKDAKKPSGNQLHRIMITLGVLATVLGGLTYGLRRYANRGTGPKSNTKIRVITQHALGPKKSLMIVQVAGESILLGVTDHNISMIKQLSLIDDEIPENIPRNFDRTLEDYEEGGDFALRGLADIRDSVSTRLKNMKNL